MNIYKYKYDIGKILILIFSFCVSLLILPFLQEVLFYYHLNDIDLNGIFVSAVVLILPVFLFLKLMKISFKKAIILLVIFNLVSVIFQIVLIKLGCFSPFSKKNLVGDGMIYFVVSSIYETFVGIIFCGIKNSAE